MAIQTACCTETTSVCGCASEDVFVATSPLNTLAFCAERCINCGVCTIVCPHAVFARGESVVDVIQPDLCMECGACQLNCPVDALRVDSGVGCASAMINAALRGLDEPTCGCDEESCC